MSVSKLYRAAEDAARRSLVPYSGLNSGCALLLEDGSLIPGARVESASFSLVIPPLVNAFSTAAALGRSDISAVASDRPLKREDVAFVAETFAGAFAPVAERLAVRQHIDELPEPADLLSPLRQPERASSTEAMMEMTREVASLAVVPESRFPVGCLLELRDGKVIPGVNVEHIDWSRVICAERNALGTMISYGFADPVALYLTCECDSFCSPCGACRQLLAELAPEATLWMDRGERSPERTTPTDLLPGFFSGNSLRERRAGDIQS